MAPEFSVIIATRNRASLLPRAMASVLGQSHSDFELIVVDDGSTDDTRQVVESIGDERVRYLRQSPAGPSQARNRGAGAARGRFLAFLDDDDEALDGWLSAFRLELVDRGSVAVSCGACYEDPDGSRVASLPGPLGPAFRDRIGRFVCGTFALERELFGEIGGYVADLRFSEQTELALRLTEFITARQLKLSHVPRALLLVHMTGTTDRRSTVPREIARAMHYLLVEHASALKRAPELRADFLATAGVAEARVREYSNARRDFFAAWRARPTRLKHLAQTSITTVPVLARRVWS